MGLTGITITLTIVSKLDIDSPTATHIIAHICIQMGSEVWVK
jgi:hypothetical protein